MILAASWTQNFTTWSHFANWANQSNWAGLLASIVLPGVLLVLWNHRKQVRLHRQTREHAERLHAETRAHTERMTGGPR